MGGGAALLLLLLSPPPFSVGVPKHRFPFLTCHPKLFSLTGRPLITNCSRRKKLVVLGAAYSSGTDALPVPSLADLERLDSDEFPALRTFENDLGRLSVVGDVSLQQALAAASADGGRAADEHIAAGLSVMVVETVFPGHPGEHSTVSTRLFLPARKVKEKVKKLRSSLAADILSGSTSNTILAMTFRQVVIQRLWSFELALFQPGTQRDMNELGSPREVPNYCTLSSADEKVLSMLAEAICTCALENTKNNFFGNKWGMPSRRTLGWLKKRRKITSMDSSVCLYQFSYNEVTGNAKKLAEVLESNKRNSVLEAGKSRHAWWPLPAYPTVEIDDISEFGKLVEEYVPAYKLQVDADKFKNVKFEGWQKSQDNRWEISLSHSQMVELADILDMYYEDSYTVPHKNLHYKVDSVSSNNLKSKPLFSSNIDLSPMELETLCISVMERVKHDLGLAGSIAFNADVGAWTGEIPNYLRTLNGMEIFQKSHAPPGGSGENHGDVTADPSHSIISEKRQSPDVVGEVTQAPFAQDVASYELLLSREGKVLGFQPTSLVAVNHWTRNPLSSGLYMGKKLSPGLFEPRLKIERPDGAILMELLVSVGSASRFSLVRPLGMVMPS
ncbi:hypothetical protein EJ110_NYTH53559 [Nymphaea thermarum]|nr:hypothetical protein EJ110_NYTH53559 [Nymphaea thermarum]